MITQITNHPFLQYQNQPILRYLQNTDNPKFVNDPYNGTITVDIIIKHYSTIDGTNSNIYLGQTNYYGSTPIITCQDIDTKLIGSNINRVVVTYNLDGTPNVTRVQPDPTGTYPDGSMGEYDAWVLQAMNLPAGISIFTLIEQQMIYFANIGTFDLY